MRSSLTALLLLACAALAGPDTVRPKHNSSYVPDDDERTRGLVAQAREAAAKGEHDRTIDALQTLLGSSSGGVVAVRGRELYVSARRWAALQLLSEQAPFGAKVLDAWRTRYNQTANAALTAAIESGDEAAIVRLVTRYPAASAAPATLLALSDAAVARGDPDRAMGYLLRAPEHAAQRDLAAFSASPAYLRRLRHLASLPPRHPAHWPTLHGSADRARTGDAIPEPGALTQEWIGGLLEEVPITFEHRSEYDQREHSPILPFYPVFDADSLYVHMGARVAVLSRATGKLTAYIPDGQAPSETRVDAMIAKSPGVRAATLDSGVLYFNRVAYMSHALLKRRNTLVAYDLKRKSVLWEAGRHIQRPANVLNKAVFYRGAPAISGDRLFVYGAVREESEGKPSRKEEAYLFCFQKRTGKLLWHRFLGYGDTEAAPSLPPQSGLAPAVKHGVVVAVSGLGVAAALDSDTGEVLWLLRYDRKAVRERERLTESTEEQVHIGSGWFREPPRIVGDVALLTPFDSDGRYGCWLRGRRDPGTGGFYLQMWYAERHAHAGRNSLLEQVAGVADSRVYYVGRRDENGMLETYQTVVSHPLAEPVFAFGRIPPLERDESTGRGVPPEVFGRATIAGRVLLVPTRQAVFRFDLGRTPKRKMKAGEWFREIPPLADFAPPAAEVEPGIAPPPAFGNLIATGGKLYSVTASRIICYGTKK